MVQLGEIIEGIGPGSQTVVYTTIWIFIAIFGIAFLGLLIWWSMFRRKSNLKVEIKLPRSDGKIINGEWGKGSYDAVKGVVYIKRPGRKMKWEPMEPFDVKEYLQGHDMLTVIQVGPGDYRPVANKSYTEHEVQYSDETKPLKDKEGNLISIV